MKKSILDFLLRGMMACGLGPVVLAVIYLVLQRSLDVQMLTVTEVCKGIVSLTVLAFIAGGMNFIYQIEKLPLMVAILIHGGILYITYLATYLFNGWLEQGLTPFLVFTGIFVLGFFVIWAVIYCVTKKKTRQVNELLKQQQRIETE